jgi:hypothetical protein
MSVTMAAAEKSSWTDERRETLRQLWPLYSASYIAEKLGGFDHCVDNGRCAVIGCAHRLGLPSKRKPERSKKEKKSRRPVTASALVFVALPRKRPSPLMDFFPDVVGSDFIGIPFVETTDKTCIYPEGQRGLMLFCGQPRQDGSSYCTFHHRVCWVKPDRKPSIWRAA